MASGASGNVGGNLNTAPATISQGQRNAKPKDLAKAPEKVAKDVLDDATGVDLLEEQLAEQKKQTQILEDEAEQAKKEIQEEEQKLRDEAHRKRQELLDQQRASTKAANRKRRFAAKNSLLTNEGGSQGLLGTGGSLYG
jgi:predicted RNase H-like nuclease (RuvC/YqgF family)